MKNYIKIGFAFALIAGKIFAMEHPQEPAEQPLRLTRVEARRLLGISVTDQLPSRRNTVEENAYCDYIYKAYQSQLLFIIDNSQESRRQRDLLYGAYCLLIKPTLHDDNDGASTLALFNQVIIHHLPTQEEETQQISQRPNEDGIQEVEAVHEKVQTQTSLVYSKLPSGRWDKKTIIKKKTHRRRKRGRFIMRENQQDNQRGNNDDDSNNGGGTNALPSSGN